MFRSEHTPRHMSTILVTGAAGTLGRALIPELLSRGDDVRALDIREVPLPAAPKLQAIRADLRKRDAIRRAADGVEAIVHAAAWHGMHLADHPPADFWTLNVDATFNVYEAAEEHGVRSVALASTMGVYGASRAAGADGSAVRLHEGLPLRPVNVYELSKVVAEEVAASYDRHPSPIRTVALRFGMFVPQPFLHAGIRFLYGGVDERDVASAVIAALDRAARGEPFAAVNVMSALPYEEEDAKVLRDDPMAVVARHWPDAPALMSAAGVKPWGPVGEWYDITHAREVLGWSPRFGFSEFIDALREGRSSL